MKKVKTTLKLTFGLITMVMLVMSIFAPDTLAILFGAGGAVSVAGFITAGSEYHGKEALDIILRPVEEKMLPSGIRVIDTGKSGSIKLTFFAKLRKILMPYASGWQGGSSATKNQKKFEVEEFKAEAAYSAQDYKDTVLEQMRVITKSNEMTEAEALMVAERTVFAMAIANDVARYFWLGDKTKVHTEAGTYPSGTAYAVGDPDKYYNQIDGVITSMVSDVYQNYVDKQNFITGWNKTTYPILYLKCVTTTVSIYPSAAARTAGTGSLGSFSGVVSTGGTLPEEKTITGTTGSPIGGKIRLLKTIPTTTTFELYDAFENFVTHVEMTDTGIENTTDYAEGILKEMIDRAPQVLKPYIRNGQAKFYCTGAVIDNYKDTLVTATLESSRSEKINGVTVYKYDGVELVDMMIDSDIERDFPSTFTRNYIILTVPDNLGLVLSHGNNTSNVELWFNKDENQNRQRAQFEMGADYIIPELAVIAYES